MLSYLPNKWGAVHMPCAQGAVLHDCQCSASCSFCSSSRSSSTFQPLFSSVRTAFSATGGSFAARMACKTGSTAHLKNARRRAAHRGNPHRHKSSQSCRDRPSGRRRRSGTPIFHDAHLRAQPHRGHAQLCKLFGREVDSQDHGHHARTSCLSSRRKPAHIRSPASDQK